MNELKQAKPNNTTASAASKTVDSPTNYKIMGTAIVLLLALAIGFYIKLGPSKDAAVKPASNAQVKQMQAGQADQKKAAIGTLVERLAERLKNSPDDGNSWMLLARSYVALGQYPDAVSAFEKAAKLVKNDSTLLADYADAMAVAQGRRLAGKPEELIQQALRINPSDNKALYLAGTAAFNRKDYKNAIQHWEKLHSVLPANSTSAKDISLGITEAKAFSGDKQAIAQLKTHAQSGTPLSGKSSETSSAGTVSGVISISPALKSKVKPDSILFIFARAADGPKIPLAVIDMPASGLPMEFTLNDAMAIMPSMKLSRFERVQIVARVSHSGSAAPQTGDLEGQTEPVSVGSKNLRVLIDHTIP